MLIVNGKNYGKIKRYYMDDARYRWVFILHHGLMRLTIRWEAVTSFEYGETIRFTVKEVF